MQEQLKLYRELQEQIQLLQEQAAAIKSDLQSHVEVNGELAAYGVRAYMKAGRKSTDHEAAATAAGVPSDLVEKHSTVKVTVAWAKVTKEAKIDTTPFTTEGKPSFVVEITD